MADDRWENAKFAVRLALYEVLHAADYEIEIEKKCKESFVNRPWMLAIKAVRAYSSGPDHTGHEGLSFIVIVNEYTLAQIYEQSKKAIKEGKTVPIKYERPRRLH